MIVPKCDIATATFEEPQAAAPGHEHEPVHEQDHDHGHDLEHEHDVSEDDVLVRALIPRIDCMAMRLPRTLLASNSAVGWRVASTCL